MCQNVDFSIFILIGVKRVLVFNIILKPTNDLRWLNTKDAKEGSLFSGHFWVPGLTSMMVRELRQTWDLNFPIFMGGIKA